MKFFTPQKNNKVLESLALFSNEVRILMEKLLKQSAWIDCSSSEENYIGVQLLEIGIGRYFAVIDCDNLCNIKDKPAYIKTAVELAIKDQRLPLTYKDIGVCGLAGDEGRQAFFYKIVGKVPPPNHAYAVFKTPGEEHVFIEDPRTGIFDRREKLQSRTNDQVCCFAAAAMFYLCFKAVTEGKNSRSTPELFADLYKSNKLRSLIQNLENKVGHSVATKMQIINSFVKQLEFFENPLTKAKPLPVVLDKLSYADVVRRYTI
ncbi:hypothetical protein [Legionella sp. km772]|uniref:hypothetical protein n=1 Tax=Legionella sp. km772 TaxID=2498111 RepID=UPI000F8D0231|nr:hypothetical protein [Legionella sp. km772]RUR05605.1 hypothetical protein ELY15_14105 [Legionella sp. km772]